MTQMAPTQSRREAELILRRLAGELGARYEAETDSYSYHGPDGPMMLKVQKLLERKGWWEVVRVAVSP